MSTALLIAGTLIFDVVLLFAYAKAAHRDRQRARYYFYGLLVAIGIMAGAAGLAVLLTFGLPA